MHAGDADFTAREYLRALGTLSNLRGPLLAIRCESVLRLTGLADAADQRLGRFSRGMLQRLGIAQALIHEPELLLLDEPTSGPDPAGEPDILDILARLRDRGPTILICTQQLAEISRLCDRVGVLSGGRLAAEARVSDLGLPGVRIVAGAPALSPEALAALRSLGPEIRVAGREIRVGAGEALQRQVLRILLGAGVAVAELGPWAGGVEEFYRTAIGGGTPGQVDGPGPAADQAQRARGQA